MDPSLNPSEIKGGYMYMRQIGVFLSTADKPVVLVPDNGYVVKTPE